MHMSAHSYARAISKHLRQTSGFVPLFIKRMNAFDQTAPMKMEMKFKKMKVESHDENEKKTEKMDDRSCELKKTQ